MLANNMPAYGSAKGLVDGFVKLTPASEVATGEEEEQAPEEEQDYMTEHYVACAWFLALVVGYLAVAVYVIHASAEQRIHSPQSTVKYKENASLPFPNLVVCGFEDIAMVSVDIQNTISPLPLPSNPVVLLKMSDLSCVWFNMSGIRSLPPSYNAVRISVIRRRLSQVSIPFEIFPTPELTQPGEPNNLWGSVYSSPRMMSIEGEPLDAAVGTAYTVAWDLTNISSLDHSGSWWRKLGIKTRLLYKGSLSSWPKGAGDHLWPTPDDTERWIGSTIYFEDFERGDNLTLSSNSSNEMWEDYLNRVPTQPLNQYDAMVLWLKMFNTVLISEENDPFDLVQIAGTIGGYWTYVTLAFGLLFPLRQQAQKRRNRARGMGTGLIAGINYICRIARDSWLHIQAFIWTVAGLSGLHVRDTMTDRSACCTCPCLCGSSPERNASTSTAVEGGVGGSENP